MYITEADWVVSCSRSDSGQWIAISSSGVSRFRSGASRLSPCTKPGKKLQPPATGVMALTGKCVKASEGARTIGHSVRVNPSRMYHSLLAPCTVTSVLLFVDRLRGTISTELAYVRQCLSLILCEFLRSLVECLYNFNGSDSHASRLLIPLACKHIIPYRYVQPSSWNELSDSKLVEDIVKIKILV